MFRRQSQRIPSNHLRTGLRRVAQDILNHASFPISPNLLEKDLKDVKRLISEWEKEYGPLE